MNVHYMVLHLYEVYSGHSDRKEYRVLFRIGKGYEFIVLTDMGKPLQPRKAATLSELLKKLEALNLEITPEIRFKLSPTIKDQENQENEKWKTKPTSR